MSFTNPNLKYNALFWFGYFSIFTDNMVRFCLVWRWIVDANQSERRTNSWCTSVETILTYCTWWFLKNCNIIIIHFSSYSFVCRCQWRNQVFWRYQKKCSSTSVRFWSWGTSSRVLRPAHTCEESWTITASGGGTTEETSSATSTLPTASSRRRSNL